MDKETFEKLIAARPQDVRAKGVLLFNGAAQCAQAYHTTPTTSVLKDWEAAEAALAKFVSAMAPPPDDGPRESFSSLAEVLDYLVAEGWKCTRASLYRHQKMGKIIPADSGAYRRKDVDKYARTFLKQVSTGKRVAEKMDELQREKVELEIRTQKEELKRKERVNAREEGALVPREQMDIELAGRAGILDAGLKHMVQSHAAEWIRLVAGDTRKVGELINAISRDIDEHINNYASAAEYQFVIEPEEEGEDPGDRPHDEEEIGNEGSAIM